MKRILVCVCFVADAASRLAKVFDHELEDVEGVADYRPENFHIVRHCRVLVSVIDGALNGSA